MNRHMPLVFASGLSRKDTMASPSVTKVGWLNLTKVVTIMITFIVFATITTLSNHTFKFSVHGFGGPASTRQ